MIPSQCWETPDELFQKCDRIWQFDLDVCADEQNHKTHRYFTEEVDGLKQNWGEYTCWCNPPYQDPMPWVMKAGEQRFLQARTVMLLPVDTSTKWFEQVFCSADEIIFLQPRVRFVGSPGSPRWANMLCVWHPYTAGLMRTAPIIHLWRWKEGSISEVSEGLEDENGVEKDGAAG